AELPREALLARPGSRRSGPVRTRIRSPNSLRALQGQQSPAGGARSIPHHVRNKTAEGPVACSRPRGCSGGGQRRSKVQFPGVVAQEIDEFPGVPEVSLEPLAQALEQGSAVRADTARMFQGVEDRLTAERPQQMVLRVQPVISVSAAMRK